MFRRIIFGALRLPRALVAAVDGIAPCFAFGFDFGGYFVNHGFLFFDGWLFWCVVGKVEAVPQGGENAADEDHGNQADDGLFAGEGFFRGRDEDIEAVGAIEGEADVFGFFAAASAFCDVEGDVLPFGRKAGKGGEGGKGKKDFLACVFYGSGAEAALAVPASNRSVIAHNVCGDIIIGNSFSFD